MTTYEDIVKVACVNFAPIVGDKESTLKKIRQFIIEACSNGANIVVFPETALTGYVFPEESTPQIAETIPGPSTEELVKLTSQYDMYVVLGMVERDKQKPDVFYNSAAVIGPDGILGAYQKVHHNTKWCQRGNEYPVFKTKYGPIGVGICYDNYGFPEVARIYALKGARLLVNATAIPLDIGVEAKDSQEFVRTTLGARSLENQIFVASANLVGTEGELTFFGYSLVLGPKPSSTTYCFWAGPAGTEEEIIIATLDLSSIKNRPEPISHILRDRRPETYSPLV